MIGRDVVAVVESPDKMFKAVLIETNGGATTSFGYEVYIEPIGSSLQRHQVARLYAAVRNENAYGANLIWADPRSLRVEYLEARYADLEDPRPVVEGERFSVELKSGVHDDSAPPGGMLYNREKK